MSTLDVRGWPRLLAGALPAASKQKARTSLNRNPAIRPAVSIFAFAVACLTCAPPAFAQDSATPPAASDAKSAIAKWRPKDGVYAYRDKDFVAHCEEAAYLDIDLAKKHVGGNEWNCDVGKITDTAPGAIKLEMTCDDYNLAEWIKAPEGKQFRETMLLNKIDQRSMYVRKTSNGKFKDARWQASYCPDEQQQRRLATGAQGDDIDRFLCRGRRPVQEIP